MTDHSAEAFRTVDHSDAIANDSVVPFYLADRGLRIAIARIDGRLYAFDELCTHLHCPLSDGLLSGTTITCQCHGSRFDITSGAVLHGPATDPLKVYEVQEVAGDVRVRA